MFYLTFFSFSYSSTPQAVASKLHGVEVDIKIIKHKGDPITVNSDADADNIYGHEDDNIIRCNSTSKYDTAINKNIEKQVPDNLCEKSKYFIGSEKLTYSFRRIYRQSISLYLFVCAENMGKFILWNG